jgi:LmbE family N-acetylglucosaminyl deacetylase
LAAVRKLEALEALRILGVSSGDVCFLRWPDGAPSARDDPRCQATIDELTGWCAGLRPRSLWATWAGEPHCDHVAAARLADDLAQQLPSLPRRLDYLVWGWGRPEISPGRLVRSLVCPDTVARRRAALACHRTQMTGLISDTTDAFRIPPNLAALTDRPVEIYLEAA